MDESLTSPAGKRRFRRRLLAWYERSARDLPWRADRDPYRVWLSEIMLQQTQVETVKSYFERFTAELPNVAALAAAPEDQVLRLWEGLGYYRRARQLHKAAQTIVTEHGGRFPRDADAVRALPGVGRYTAGAILSIAFDAREPILEANTMRLFARLLAYQDDPRSAAGQEILWRTAETLLPRTRTGDFNQALMELGSQICKPRQPACEQCPVATLCAARAKGLTDTIPPAKAPTRFEEIREAAVVVYRRGKVLMRRCREGERWAGLWDFPRFQVESRRGAALRREIAAKVESTTGVVVGPHEKLTTIRHGVTRYRITLDCHRAEYASGRVRSGSGLRWFRPTELADLPLSTTGRKIGKLVEQGAR
jgi:A/G-specific adenine glycosylase